MYTSILGQLIQQPTWDRSTCIQVQASFRKLYKSILIEVGFSATLQNPNPNKAQPFLSLELNETKPTMKKDEGENGGSIFQLTILTDLASVVFSR